MTIARHFNAGLVVKSIQVPEGRPSLPDEMEGHGGNIVPFILPSLRDLCRCQRIPGAETPGYYRVVPLGRTRCGWDSRAPNAAGATGRVARPVKYSGDNGKPWRGALFHRARPVKYGKNNGKPWRRHYFTGRGARCLAMTEIKLGRTPHSALSIPHLNGSFPVFILGWTIGAIGV